MLPKVAIGVNLIVLLWTLFPGKRSSKVVGTFKSSGEITGAGKFSRT